MTEKEGRAGADIPLPANDNGLEQGAVEEAERHLDTIARAIGRHIPRTYQGLGAGAAEAGSQRQPAKGRGAGTGRVKSALERKESLMTRVALYARYSSDNQSVSSIEDQFRISRDQADVAILYKHFKKAVAMPGSTADAR